MCIILPVDHIPCTHTVAIWQHCVNAPRSKIHGLEPCSKIRSHSRPILTRKVCFNCGGPRYFARRGGLAERGGSNGMMPPHERMESYDSGYQSDVIHEESDEDDYDYALSPRASRIMKLKLREQPRRAPPKLRSPGRRPSWKPNLKHELSGDQSQFYRRESIDSTISRFDDEKWHTNDPSDSESSQSARFPLVRQPPQSRRRGSTLLHPSSPRTDEPVLQQARAFPFPQPTPPSTPPQRLPPFGRKESTLPRPSSPVSTTFNLPAAKPYLFPIPLPTPTTPNRPSTPPQRPGLQPRKNSTLLHPSSPPDIDTPINQHTSFSSFPFSSPRSTQRKVSIMHSSLSDDEWDQPLHSAHSDVEFDLDDEDEGIASGSTSSASSDAEEIVFAQTARMGRASRVELTNSQMWILREA